MTRRLVVDANVLFSALYDPASTCGQIILLAIEGEVVLAAPETVREEMRRALLRKLGYSAAEAGAALAALPVAWSEPMEYEGRLPTATAALRDATDAPIVALALALGADVVSADKDLHALKPKLVKVWRPSELGGRRKRER